MSELDNTLLSGFNDFMCIPFPRLLQVDPSEVVLGKLIGRGCAGRVYLGSFRGEAVAVKVVTHCEAEANGCCFVPLGEEQVCIFETCQGRRAGDGSH